MDDRAKGRLDPAQGIGEDIRALVAMLLPKAETGAALSTKELGTIGRLIRRSEAAIDAAGAQVHKRRQQEIEQLRSLVDDLDAALSTPGLDRRARDDLQALRRRKRARLVRLQTKQAMDFGGMLPARDLQKIQALFARVRRDVARRRQAAVHVANLLLLADVVLMITTRTTARG